MKNLLIIKGHPREKSFCNALTNRYVEGAQANGADIRTLNLPELALEPWLKYDWSHNHTSLPNSPDLDRSKELVSWCDHMVFAYPVYWAGAPALVKLFLEMVITAHFAFKYKQPFLGKIPRWNRLLKGRTASLLVTMDAPPVFMNLVDRDPGGKMMRDILRFTGVKLLKRHYFGSVILSSQAKKDRWLKKAYDSGVREAR